MRGMSAMRGTYERYGRQGCRGGKEVQDIVKVWEI